MAEITIDGGGTPSTDTDTPTNTEILASIKVAIYNSMEAGGVIEFRIAGQQVRRYELEELLQAEKRYTILVAQESNGGPVSLAGFNRYIR